LVVEKLIDMEQHKYHRFFVPILRKLYEGMPNKELIDISEFFTGSEEQNYVILRNLNDSEFAAIKKEAKVDFYKQFQKPPKYFGKILPLGIDYIEKYAQELIKARQKKPPIGFKQNND
jgi:hypothetical protein